ncbi:GntR family transcriptional regulator [Flexivirga oryzae]|uniref:DNA-binding GntR family transcriptional regulator n=1 Tax=Flexivirga oryzae TaxID=1794944 RepID=A0A839NB03_9MICO|nr:DNA-binding GntR family transcriptional regulator [Flexivirga oryzae]
MATHPVFSKSEYAYHEVKDRILGGRLPPGSVIGQESLASELGVSTTPLREALKRLASEGLVQLDTHRDARVTTVSAEEARGLYAVRKRLDPFAAGLAAQHRSQAVIDEIEAALAALRPRASTADVDALLVHRRFHRTIYRAAGNLPLVTILDGLWDKMDLYRLVALTSRWSDPEHIARTQAEHEELADAVVRADAARAEQLMHEHIEGSLGYRAILRLESDAPLLDEPGVAATSGGGR